LPPEGISLKDRLAEIERNIIEQALERSQGNVSRTAKLLNLQRTTLIEKINKYELRTACFWSELRTSRLFAYLVS
jgi:sigma-54 specific flagellar transcriptional regulator A